MNKEAFMKGYTHKEADFLGGANLINNPLTNPLNLGIKDVGRALAAGPMLLGRGLKASINPLGLTPSNFGINIPSASDVVGSAAGSTAKKYLPWLALGGGAGLLALTAYKQRQKQKELEEQQRRQQAAQQQPVY